MNLLERAQEQGGTCTWGLERQVSVSRAQLCERHMHSGGHFETAVPCCFLKVSGSIPSPSAYSESVPLLKQSRAWLYNPGSTGRCGLRCSQVLGRLPGGGQLYGGTWKNEDLGEQGEEGLAPILCKEAGQGWSQSWAQPCLCLLLPEHHSLWVLLPHPHGGPSRTAAIAEHHRRAPYLNYGANPHLNFCLMEKRKHAKLMELGMGPEFANFHFARLARAWPLSLPRPTHLQPPEWEPTAGGSPPSQATAQTP